MYLIWRVWSRGWLFDVLMVARSFVFSRGCLFGLVFGRLFGLVDGCLVGWSHGRLVVRLGGWSVGLSVGWLDFVW